MVTWLDPVQVGCGCFSGNNLLELVQLVFVAVELLSIEDFCPNLHIHTLDKRFFFSHIFECPLWIKPEFFHISCIKPASKEKNGSNLQQKNSC